VNDQQLLHDDVRLCEHPSSTKRLLVLQLLEAPMVLTPLVNFVQELRSEPVLLSGKVHRLLEGLLYVSSCASSGD
jgi:hypothetical protein